MRRFLGKGENLRKSAKISVCPLRFVPLSAPWFYSRTFSKSKESAWQDGAWIELEPETGTVGTAFLRTHQKWAGKLVPRENRRKVLKICLTHFDDFDFFSVREKCRKVSKNIFDTFWRFLTWPFSAGPFCGLLILQEPKPEPSEPFSGTETRTGTVPSP